MIEPAMDMAFELESCDGAAAIFVAGTRRLRLMFPSASIVRVTYVEGKAFSQRSSRIVVAGLRGGAFEIAEDRDAFTVSTHALAIVLRKSTGALTYRDAAGRVLMQEPEAGGRSLTAKDVYCNVFGKDTEIAFAQSVDGARATATRYETVLDRSAFEATLSFRFAQDEALFGLGSHEEGYGNLRGRSRDLYQQNMKAVVPCLVSTRGYGVLLDCESSMRFKDDEHGSFWWADVVEELDYYVFCGANYDDVMQSYRLLTGATPMLPAWAFGYMQSKERYVNARELVDVVREYRARKIPLDGIVLDWKSWPNGGGWGQKSFDAERFADPEALTGELHALGARLMVSMWPIMTGGCADQREMLEHDAMLGNQATYNAFSAEARALYWEQAERGLFSKGIDAWWCDCTEPFEADWAGAVKPAPEERLEINTRESKLYIDAGEINSFSLLHSQGIYEGQRRASSAKRVLNLTRSSYAGQHRYGTVTWNGDICATWEWLRKCIPEGLNFCATGEAYWTVDAGGFFIDHKPELWFWRGDYADGCRGLTDMNAPGPDANDTGCRDLGFWELYVRWVQYAAFLPMFRSHGTDAAREIWRFGEAGSPFYDAIADAIRLRYQLLPYIYSLAGKVTFKGTAMMRAVALDFPEDVETHSLTDEFLFGRELLICPVTRPMYFDPGSQAIANAVKTREVYLPAGCEWIDFHRESVHHGGTWITADAPLATMPVFVRSGSIVVMSEPVQFWGEAPGAPYEIRVYPGSDAVFHLYEDRGDGYDYEQGEFALIKLMWSEAEGELIVAAREGGFAEMANEREYRIVFVSEQGRSLCVRRYTGNGMRVRRADAKESSK